MKFSRILGIITGLTLALVLAFFPFLPSSSQPKRPNILLVVSDDLGFSDLGLFGSEVSTPITDDLARQGRIFTNFHASP
ncbi:MAG: sulfatase-like hydrolase/transferase, partial [Snowella sp.]|nr:sulfatase-like hydrolase/transferase [Snowella sp.]